MMSFPPVTPSGQTHALRIFLVENHADTLKWLSLYLEDLGHTVSTARTMQEALRKLPETDCNVLISDIGLPDGDGWQLLQSLDLHRPLYAVAMSGFGLNSDRAKSEAAGFRNHLLKPFKTGELEKVLERAAAEMAA